MTATTDIVPDSERSGFIGALPPRLRPYASLMRLDRPIGTWLLYWPCAWSVALAGVGGRWGLFGWLLLGAFAMRSAGCVYNDIIDRDLDARVERTRLRPLASRRVSVAGAWVLIALLCLLGLVVLLQLNWTAAAIALASVAFVAAYPFMKRITWWPQAWLGLVFSWGALVGWAAVAGEIG
nr:4-hydroxybenzoate octaprenyltransferase [Sphingomonas sp.]